MRTAEIQRLSNLARIAELHNVGGKNQLQGLHASAFWWILHYTFLYVSSTPSYLPKQVHLSSLSIQVSRKGTKWDACIFQIHKGNFIF